MCFSAEASFASAGVLAVAGGYCLRAALRRRPRDWAFALIPLGFGLQQAAEGGVWLAVAAGDAQAARVCSAVFLFFALAVWPFWFPLAAAVGEPRRGRARLLYAWAVLATAWLWVAYLPVLLAPEALAVEVAGHSLHYKHGDEWVFGGAVRWPATAAYILCVGGPLLATSRRRQMLVPLVLGFVAVVVAAWVYAHAYTSVWCFFAALLSAYTAWDFARTPPAGT